jgi:hypothetical protein
MLSIDPELSGVASRIFDDAAILIPSAVEDVNRVAGL